MSIWGLHINIMHIMKIHQENGGHRIMFCNISKNQPAEFAATGPISLLLTSISLHFTGNSPTDNTTTPWWSIQRIPWTTPHKDSPVALWLLSRNRIGLYSTSSSDTSITMNAQIWTKYDKPICWPNYENFMTAFDQSKLVIKHDVWVFEITTACQG